MSHSGNDGFDEPFGGDVSDNAMLGDGGIQIDPRLLVALIVLGLVIVLTIVLSGYFGHHLGRRKLNSQRVQSAEAIYKSVRWYLDRALKSSGAVILERAREVSEVLEARLGFVIALNGKPGKIIGELDTALKGEKATAPADPTPKVKVPMATEAHYLEVWKALQDLNEVWQDKAAVLAMIAKAQDELARAPKKDKLVVPSLPKVRPAKAAAAPAPSAPTPEATPAPKPVAETSPDPEPTPPPPPAPAPPPKSGKALPAHKRNMLA